MRPVGIALWLVCGFVTFAISRMIRVGRTRRWRLELALALLGSFALGTLATALDFAGWNDLDWRAALFVLLGTFALIGLARGQVEK